MPTGYTYPVCEGKITEFPDFALSCARAFGALITMRDDAADAPIPDEIAPCTSYAEEYLAEAKCRLGEIQAMTDAETDAAASADYREASDGRAAYLADKDMEASRINAMLVKVRAWTPPTAEHTEMKKFMIDQLVMSMPGSYAPPFPEAMDGKTWRQREIDRQADTIVRFQKQIDEEIERAAGRTQWIKSLRASLAA